MASFNEISPNQLFRLVGTPEAPLVVDVRDDTNHAADPRAIPGAIRIPFDEMDGLTIDGVAERVVVICHKGLKLSHGAAAVLRERGIAAEVLGGGHRAWVAAELPLIATAKLPEPDEQGRTVWVTRHRPKIDRVACPWLIRRFVDRRARFLFVPTSQVMDVAARFGATPFDVEGAFWSHRGEACTFEAMISELGLHIQALERMAKILRGADTGRHDLAAQSPGVLAISAGLSRMFRDDIAQLDAGMLLYDALYRWARDAFEEKHDWPSHPGSS